MNILTKKPSHKTPPTRSRRRDRRPRQRISRAVRWLASHAAFVLLALAVIFALGVMALASHQSSAAGSAADATKPPATTASGAPSAPSAPSALPAGWVRLASQAPADILAAARQSPLLQTSSGDGGDHPTDFSRLGAPVLVRALRTDEFGVMPDFYVVPVLNAAGQTTDAIELQLDAGHTAVQVVAVVTYAQPRPAGRIALADLSAAVAAVGAQHHVTLQSAAQPVLVYIPMDANAPSPWTAGGASPVDPVWLVPGADGQSHVFGTDGKVYYLRELPGAPQAPTAG